MFGSVEGEKAKKKRRSRMKRGRKRRSKGGGGRGGNTKGRSRMDKVRRAKSKTEYLIMHAQLMILLSFFEQPLITITLLLRVILLVLSSGITIMNHLLPLIINCF